jgi:hypothetical protein
MKNLPLDADRLGAALCISVGVKTDPMTGVIRTTREGVTQYVVAVAVTPAERKAALIEVTVDGEPSGLVVGTYVKLRGLEGFMWEMEGRAGVSFRADSIVPTLAPLPPDDAPAGPAVPGAAAAGPAAKGVK